MVIYDAAWNHNVTTYVFEKSAVDCKPQIEPSSPQDGGVVSGVVKIQGTVDFYDNSSGFVSVYIGDDWVKTVDVADGGSFTHSWNTFHREDGNHTIHVVAVDDATYAHNWTESVVTVLNPRDPHTDSESFAGSVGCSAGALFLRIRDSCQGEATQATEVMAGLTAGRLTVSWDGDEVAGIDALSVSVWIGTKTWEATAAPGDDALVLEMGDGALLTTGVTGVQIQVRAAFGEAAPSVVLEEDYEIEADWAYWGATLP